MAIIVLSVLVFVELAGYLYTDRPYFLRELVSLLPGRTHQKVTHLRNHFLAISLNLMSNIPLGLRNK